MDELDAGEVHARTARFWDLSGPLPLPHDGWLRCPICASQPVVRWWRFHERSGHPTVRYRCDVSVKCTGCAHVWVHGVALDEDTWTRCRPKVIGRQIHRRDARRILEGG